jgi:putative glutamine amidotransferase
MTIGITDCSKYQIYEKWIQNNSPAIKTVKLSEKTQNFQDFAQCQGILFSGGEDVHPRFYGKPEYYEFCYADDVNEARDEFEMKLMEMAIQNKIPVLGICRGLQIINVHFGGTLIPDIPTWGRWNHSKLPDNSDRYHSVEIDPNSTLFQIIKHQKGEINSNHHQSADRVGKGLVVNAFSADSVIEGIEYANPEGKGYLNLVQWHPERMRDLESPFSENIKRDFLNNCSMVL